MNGLLRRGLSRLATETARKRKPITEETLAKRKEKKYLRTINQFAAENTGERQLKWTDPKKLRQLA